MTPQTHRWALLISASCLLACGTEAPTPGDGSAGEATGGAATGSGGNVATSGGGGSPTTTNGGSADTAGSGGAMGGAGTAAGGGGAMGGGGAGAAGGAGGEGNGPVLPKRVLLYHFSTLVIDSVPAQLTMLSGQLEAWGYEVVDSVSPGDFSAESLAKFGAVGMINTCFEPFGAGKSGDAETTALKTFVENGGGLFGTHCASVTFQAAEPPHAYNGVIGGRGGHGYFDGTSACRKTEETHVASDMLPATFDFSGNLDNADYLAPDTKVLVMCKWSGGDMKDTAVSWIRNAGKGRVFYTNFAKEVKDLNDATLGTKHILPGLAWVLRR